MASFTSLFSPTKLRPRSQFFSALKDNFIRDALTLETWISLGALLQLLLLSALPAHFAVLPTTIYISCRLVESLITWGGMRQNSHMSRVIPGKVSAQYPDSAIPSQKPVVVIRLAARSNHLLGVFHPHMQVISSLFKRMVKDLDDHSEMYDYLGSSLYIGNERETHNEIMILAYFSSYEGLHNWTYETNGVHREAWNYWNKDVMGRGREKVGRMFSIMHELYEIPAGKWESIYINYHPTGLGATTHKVSYDGEDRWASPLVDASKGKLRTSKGRRALSEGNDHDVNGIDQ